MIKSGDYVTYKVNRSKSLVHNATYKVSDVKVHKRKYGSDIYLKIDGQPRWLSSRAFRRVSTQESRDINLKEVFDQETGVAKVDLSIRKIDRYVGKERDKIIVTILFQSMLDVSRNNMSITEWAVNKIGKAYDISEDDIKPFLPKNIKTLIKSFE